MANDVQRSGNNPDIDSGNQLVRQPEEKDPETWYGLVWRLARTAVENNGNLIRMSILIVLIGGALWLLTVARP